MSLILLYMGNGGCRRNFLIVGFGDLRRDFRDFHNQYATCIITPYNTISHCKKLEKKDINRG